MSLPDWRQMEATVNARRLLCAVLLLSQAFIVGVASAQSQQTPSVPPPSGWDPRFGPPPSNWDPKLWAAETALCQKVLAPPPADTSGMTAMDWATRNSQYEVCLSYSLSWNARRLAPSLPAATGTLAYPAIVFTPLPLPAASPTPVPLSGESPSVEPLSANPNALTCNFATVPPTGPTCSFIGGDASACTGVPSGSVIGPAQLPNQPGQPPDVAADVSPTQNVELTNFGFWIYDKNGNPQPVTHLATQ